MLHAELLNTFMCAACCLLLKCSTRTLHVYLGSVIRRLKDTLTRPKLGGKKCRKQRENTTLLIIFYASVDSFRSQPTTFTRSPPVPLVRPSLPHFSLFLPTRIILLHPDTRSCSNLLDDQLRCQKHRSD
jgi:hypothetical protein